MKRTARGAALATLMLAGASSVSAGAPEWLRQAARLPAGSYDKEVSAVLLLDEKLTTVKANGEIMTVHRRAYRILRPDGREFGRVRVYFDRETKLTFLKAWSIPADGKEFEVKEGDAVEMAIFDGVLYSDNRFKELRIPAADPGNVVGYEYEQKERPLVFQDRWHFQNIVPVVQARFVLRLPDGWEYSAKWFNYEERAAQPSGENTWVWEVDNVPAIEEEASMPPWHAVAGWVGIRYFPPEEKLQSKRHTSWEDVGRWYWQLASGRQLSSPQIEQRVQELTAGKTTLLEKLKALAGFVQRDVRYVAIEIGIGGYQPHTAQEVFVNRYGDCKDKVTLLAAMLRGIGIESNYVLMHTERGVVNPDFASMRSFNHVILAMRLPEELHSAGLHAVSAAKTAGRVLFFDPTDPITPLGYLPANEQANFGLLVGVEGGELIQLPLLPASANQMRRVAKLTLSSAGSLSGEVREIRSGEMALHRRAQFLEIAPSERTKVVERLVGAYLAGSVLTGAEVENLERYDQHLELRFRFVAERYAKSAGDLLLVRPRVLGQKSDAMMEKKERKHAVEFEALSLESDEFEIALPSGYVADELPSPVKVDYGFAAYESQTEVKGNVLKYRRIYQIKEVRVPPARQEELKKFYRQVAADERSSAVLKRAAP